MKPRNKIKRGATMSKEEFRAYVLKAQEDRNKMKVIKTTPFKQTVSMFLAKKNMSQNELCRQLNISSSKLCQYKAGTVPSIKMIERICDLLKCEIKDIIVLENVEG